MTKLLRLIELTAYLTSFSFLLLFLAIIGASLYDLMMVL